MHAYVVSQAHEEPMVRESGLLDGKAVWRGLWLEGVVARWLTMMEGVEREAECGCELHVRICVF